jgi:hypothetical protein
MVTLEAVPVGTDVIEFIDHLDGLTVIKKVHSISTAEKVRGCPDALVTATAVRTLAGVINEGLKDAFRGYFP